MQKEPTAVIVGRINVGKSSLFNRLTESKKSITSDIPGTTRDRNFGKVIWRAKQFMIVDTGGVDIDSLKHSIAALITKKPFKTRDTIEKNILIQTQAALKEAAVVIFVVDGQAGLLPQDRELALILKKLGKPVILACNKIDNPSHFYRVNEFFKLGLGEPIALSAKNGSGTGDLLEVMVKKMKRRGRPTKLKSGRPINVAIIGRPNVGKSSLLNAIVGEERVIVSEIPQTTREPQDTELTYLGHNITLIDTAGLKKKAKTSPGIDKIASFKTLETLKRADIVLLVIESDKPISRQDVTLSGEVAASWASVAIVANKWDVIEAKTTETGTKMSKYLYTYLNPLKFSPIIFLSAKTGLNVKKILDLIIELWEKRQITIPQARLDALLVKITKKKRPMAGKNLGHRYYTPYITKIEQTDINPPQFTITLRAEQSLNESYIRMIENQIRETFSLPKMVLKINS